MILIDLAYLLGLIAGSFFISTLIVRLGIPKLKTGATDDAASRQLPESSNGRVFDFTATGFWIGLCETFLIVVFILVGAFSALAIIIGAKEFARSEKIRENPSYYLLGTLANLCVAILFALAARILLLGGPLMNAVATG